MLIDIHICPPSEPNFVVRLEDTPSSPNCSWESIADNKVKPHHDFCQDSFSCYSDIGLRPALYLAHHLMIKCTSIRLQTLVVRCASEPQNRGSLALHMQELILSVSDGDRWTKGSNNIGGNNTFSQLSVWPKCTHQCIFTVGIIFEVWVQNVAIITYSTCLFTWCDPRILMWNFWNWVNSWCFSVYSATVCLTSIDTPKLKEIHHNSW